nr:MATE family efflux transporter [Clostridium swellfunianum]
MIDREKRLANESIPKLLMSFSIPAIIGMLVNALYNIVDRIYIGKMEGVGQYAITGVGLNFPIMTVIMAFAMLSGIGAAATISIRLGQKKKDEAEHILGNAFVLSILFSIIITIVGLLSVDKLLLIFGASENTFGYAKDYIVIILIGTIFNVTAFSMNHAIRASGNPKRAASTMLIGAVLNTILDPIFIFTFNMGVKGAALATIISQAVSAAWVISYFLTGKSNLKLKVSNFRLDARIVKTIFAIGMSPFAMQLAASVVSITANKSLLTYGGDLAVGAMTVINSISTLFLMPIFGINQGFQPIVGYNYGAKAYDRVIATLKYAIFAATSIVVVGFIFVQIFAPQAIMLFNDNTELVAIGSKGIRIYLFMLPIIGFQIISTNYFQSIGKAKISMFLSLLRQVLLLIPLYVLLPRIFGTLTSIWFAGPLADATASVLTSFFLFRELKHLKDAHESSTENSKLVEESL